MRVLRIVFPLILCLFYRQTALAGTPAVLRDRRIAVYFSKKTFHYDDNYLKLLAQYVRACRQDTLPIDDIKLSTLIHLGGSFCGQLGAAAGASQVQFVNESPELAGALIDAYDGETHEMAAPGPAFQHYDWILIVNPLVLGSYKTSVVYSRSNRIITEMQIRKTGRLRLELYHPGTGEMRHVAEACLDEANLAGVKLRFDFRNAGSPTGKFLAALFTQGLGLLETGRETDCVR